MAFRYNPNYPTEDEIKENKKNDDKWDRPYKRSENCTLCYQCGRRRIPGGDIIVDGVKYPICTSCAIVKVPAKTRKCIDCGKEFLSLNDFRQCNDCKRKRKRTIFRKD